jgi:hypothetical protein
MPMFLYIPLDIKKSRKLITGLKIEVRTGTRKLYDKLLTNHIANNSELESLHV